MEKPPPEPPWQIVPDGRFAQIVGVSGVTAERLIPTIPAQHDFDAPGRSSRDQKCWYGRCIREGLVIILGQTVENAPRIGQKNSFGVFRVKLLSHLPGV